MENQIIGLHHVTAIAGDAQRNPDFYTGVLAWRRNLAGLGFEVSPVMDREYFHSIYFREPGHILFEIATDPPCFAWDEAPDQLGTHLKLPQRHGVRRTQIERALPILRLPATGEGH